MSLDFSICEGVHATGRSPWHIRSNAGPLKFGGGIDTASLCGRVQAGWGWDLAGHVETLANCHFMCRDCVKAWRESLPSSNATMTEKKR